MSQVGIGLIGCGLRLKPMAQQLVESHEGLSIKALCDPNAQAVTAMKESAAPDAGVYEDYRDLLADERVDWVMIATPNHLHREHAVAAMESGKHVFCEKPLAINLEDALAIHETQQRTGRTFFFGLTLRYSPHYTTLKQLVADGAIGRIVSMEFNETLAMHHGGFIHQDWRRRRELAGTHMLEKCCHDVDIVNWLTESLPTRVASFGGNNFFTPENAHHVDRIGPNPMTGEKPFMNMPGVDCKNPFTIDKDIVDNQVAILEYANEVRVSFHTNCAASIKERRNYICGSEGTIRADKAAGTIEVVPFGWNEPETIYRTAAIGGHGGADPQILDWLAQCMLQGQSPRAGAVEGLNAAIPCFAVDDAMDHGTVVDVRPYWRRAGIDPDRPVVGPGVAPAAAAR